MSHLNALCKDIGPRPSTSARERQAAAYVAQTLTELGLKDVQEQLFMSQNSWGWITIPPVAMAALGIPVGWLGGVWGKGIGAILLLFGTFTLVQNILAVPPIFQPLIARWQSQNVIATIPPSGETKRQLFLVGHLDSNKQRLQVPPSEPGLLKTYTTLGILAGLAAGLSLLANIAFQLSDIYWWQWLMEGFILLSLMGLIIDEFQPDIEGANDNATAVSVLLSIAEALQRHPLKNTATTLLFTGCEEPGCVGTEAYLAEFHPDKEASYWINLEMVGTGNLCYVTRHGISYLATYRPHPEMVSLAADTATKYPDFRVSGKDMLIIEENAVLNRHGYKSICIAGYNEKGFLPNWHRLSDTVENIEPDTLERAAGYTWALMQEINQLPD
ncbi:MAG: M28 family peptidase, partial [Anaerolineae bacterium]|nr:M28 family peptidase [Anaerolineae bacterium]